MNPFFKVLASILLVLGLLRAGPAAAIQADSLTTYPITPACAFSSATANVIHQTTSDTYGKWIRELSGKDPVTVGGQPYQITTRFSPALFDGRSKAFEYLKEQVQALYPQGQVNEQKYSAWYTWTGQTWENLIVTIPGRVHPEQVVIMSAHFDSIAPGSSATLPYLDAPGADDNASGSASLLEALRLLRDMPLDRTVKLVWFTGEEQGLWGSGAYTYNNDLSGVIGVVNLDMFAYDGDNDRCFEIHVSRTLDDPSAAASNAVGQCMARAITDYGLDLKYDYFTEGAIPYSDHKNFWDYGIGAIEVGQNFSTNNTPGGCTNQISDENPNYHRPTDTFDNINLPYALSIHKAALATVIDLANANPSFLYFPLLTNNP